MRATGWSAHHGIGDRKKSLGSVEFPFEQKRAVIAMLAQEYPVSVVCEVVECARSSYYHRPTPSPDAGLQQAIEEVAAAWPRYCCWGGVTNAPFMWSPQKTGTSNK